MKWTIAFDSGCDIRDLGVNQTAHLELVPLTITVGDQHVVDNGELSLEDFQNMLDSTKAKTGTACPSPADWYKAMVVADNVIAITISGGVSGSHQSAMIAKNMVLEDYPDKNIFIQDTLSGSGTMEFLVRKAAELIDSGASFQEVCDGIVEYRKNSQIYFLLQNVDNVMSNGRLNPIVGRAVKALRMGLLATVTEEGTMDVIAKTRTFKKAMEKSITKCLDRGCNAHDIIISHCLNEEGANLMKTKLLEAFPEARIEIRKTGLLCGYYAEKGGLIVALQD